MMWKLVAVLLGILFGAVGGLVVAVPILVILNIMGMTTSREDLPLHGVIPFIATIYGCALVGSIVGATLAWRRSDRESRRSARTG
jgi:hypothetical protein